MTFVVVPLAACHLCGLPLLLRLGLLMATLRWLLVQTTIYFLCRVKALILDQRILLLPFVCFLFAMDEDKAILAADVEGNLSQREGRHGKCIST